MEGIVYSYYYSAIPDQVIAHVDDIPVESYTSKYPITDNSGMNLSISCFYAERTLLFDTYRIG